MAMAKSFPQPRRSRRRRSARRAFFTAAALTSCLALSTMTGCQSSVGKKVLSTISPRYDESLKSGLVRPEDSTPHRFLSRYLTPAATPHTSGASEAKSLSMSNEGWTPVKIDPNPKADAALEAATALYRQGKYSEAEPKLAAIAKAQKGKPWGERAQFLLAESYYEQQKYKYAYDAYELLIKEYPGTEYVDKLVKREFVIAQKWLDNSEGKAKPEDKFSLTDAFTGKAPLVDGAGYALTAFEKVRLHDPTGPLSDDALMKTAQHKYDNRDFEEASVYYDQLVTDHPKSEHLQKAQLASIDSKLKAYAGPQFDGQGLDGARDMIKQTMATFPERQTGNDKLYHTLDVINDQHAERAYTTGLYYKKTGKVISAEYYFGMVSAKWPKSEWAKKSKVELGTLAKLPRQESAPSRIMATPGAVDPFSSGPAGGGGNGLGTNGGGGAGGMGSALGGMGGMGGMG
jgi:outer membrane protein assembly factor BamD (BamD/ComL family)